MSFTRKRPRDGPADQPPPKRHDHKQPEKATSTHAKVAPSAASKSSMPVEPAKAVAAKVVPPPPKTGTSILDQEPLKIDVSKEAIQADLPAALNLLETIQNISTEIVEKSISLGAEAIKADAGMKDLERRGFVALSQFRTIHRFLHLEVDQRRQQTAQHGEKEFGDAMQALLSSEYEYDAYKMLVDAKPSIEDAVELISQEEYLSQSVGHALQPKDSDTPHKLLMKRLRFEEDQRRGLTRKLKEIPVKQTALRSTLNVETRDLDALKQKIRDIGSQINALKHSLKLEDPTHQPTDPRAPFLPQPLYNLYVQLISWISVFGSEKVDISISGSIESARKALQLSQEPQTSKPSQTASGPDKDQQTHPLSVIANFVVVNRSTAVSRKTSFIFEYLTHLNIVIVTPSGNEEPKLLSNLFPGDFGLQSPNWSNNLLVPSNTQIMPKRARAYEWLQSLSGLHFQRGPSEMNEASHSSLKPIAFSLTDTMELLKRRVQIRFSLSNVNSLLASGRIEVENWKSPDIPKSALLRKWSEKTAPQALALLKEIEQYYQDHHISQSIPSEISEDATYYCGVIGTPDAIQSIQVLAKLEPDYPFARTSYFVTGSKDYPPNELKLLLSAFNALDIPIPATSPENHISYYVAWLRDCISIFQDINKNGSQSSFNRLDRYEMQTW